MNKKPVIGLTGGIACGKTTVARIFQKLGAYVIDADSAGHQILKSDPNVKKQIVETFGQRVLNDKDEVDRSKLGPIVFNNPELLQSLNRIIHPRIINTINAEVKEKLSLPEYKAILVDVVLLIECNMMDMMDYVVLVHAEDDIQMQRLLQRGLSKEDAQKRIKSQMSFKEKQKFADFIIYNSSSLSDTEKQVEKIWGVIGL
jgi:dephospho-CoA kinase